MRDALGSVAHVGHVREEEHCVGVPGLGDGRDGHVRVHVEEDVDVVRARGDGGHHRHVARRAEGGKDLRVHLVHGAHVAERGVHHAGLEEPAIGAREPHRGDARALERCHQHRVHLAAEDLEHGPRRAVIGDPQPAHPARLEAQGVSEPGHLGAAAVDHHDLVPALQSRAHARGEARAEARGGVRGGGREMGARRRRRRRVR